MNPLHSHDIMENLLDTVVHPFDVEGYQLGSDPLTHKKMRENANKGACTAGTSSSSSSSSSSSTDQTAASNNSTMQDDSTMTSTKMDETKDGKEAARGGS